LIIYLQQTNRNSFKLRYRKYRKYRSDIWGRIGALGKTNKFTLQMARFAKRELRNSVRHFRKRRGAFKRLEINEITEALKQHEYNYSTIAKAEPKKKTIPHLGGRVRLLAKKYKYFYNLKIRNQPLRKILRVKHGHPAKSPHHLMYEKRFSYHNDTTNRVKIETRIDVLLYRLTLVPYIWDARRLIRYQLVYTIKPAFPYFMKPKPVRMGYRKRKFFSYHIVKKYFHSLAIFNAITLQFKYALWRKSVIIRMLQQNQFFSFPPKYLWMKYNVMAGFLIASPRPSEIGYPWPGSLLFFLGSALYY
jgi:ribosomal protein S4